MDKTIGLDIVRRLTVALTNESEAKLDEDATLFDPEKETFICELPKHLRHLFLLLNALRKQRHEAQERYQKVLSTFDENDVYTNETHQIVQPYMQSLMLVTEHHNAIASLFSAGLRPYLGLEDTDEPISLVRICQGWKVVRQDAIHDAIEESLAAILALALGGDDTPPH